MPAAARARTLVPPLIAGVLAAGCAGSNGSAAAVPAGALLGSWQLTGWAEDGAALPVPDGARATLRVADDRLSGTSFCNSYTGAYRLDGARLEITGLGGTEMGCEPEVMAAEAAFVGALGGAHEVAVEDGDLVLTGPAVELRFEVVPPEPVRAVVGTRWVLEALVDGAGDDGAVASSTVVGPPATLQVAANGTVTASTGCRDLTGTWRSTGDTTTVGEYGWTSYGCDGPVARQDEHVVRVLGGGFGVAVDGASLTLTGADGAGLVYRAAD